MSKAAVIQNSVGVGGRSKVIAQTINILTTKYNEVTVHTLSGSQEIDKFVQSYNLGRQNINFTTHFGSFVPSTIYQQILLNYSVKDEITNCDIVFNSNNCLRFLPSGPKYIHYFHFPIPRWKFKNKDYKSVKYDVLFCPLSAILQSSTPNVTGAILANSKFTANHVKQGYNINGVQVRYPPSIESVTFDGFSGEGVVSLGSFHPNKRQLFQLKIASHYPNVEFNLIGSAASIDYIQKCRRYIEENGLTNVSLHPDASNASVDELLTQSKVFLHSMKRECFGISIVEAINHGCVPVVHNSGGQREIVADSVLRYNNIDECVDSIHSALSGDFSPSFSITSQLEMFTSQSFRSTILELIENPEELQ